MTTLTPPPDPDVPPPRSAGLRGALRGRSGLWIAGAALLALLAAFGLYLAALIPASPGIDDLRQVQAARPSVLLSADGQVLATFRKRQQEPVPLAKVSPYVVKALLDTEDRRFYDHHGLDIRRTASALVHTLQGDTQGGSTITQQLARNLFPEDIGRSRNLHRKFKEMVTALRIERLYTKDQILEHYLNSAPFLYNAVGIEMAARTYFDKPASQLDPAEAATLVGMLKGTHYYNPVLFPERAVKRRNLVLQQMANAGDLPAAEFDRLRQTPLRLSFRRPEDDLGTAPHFAAYARRWLLEWADAHDVDLYADGLRIETTLDTRLQKLAEHAVEVESAVLQKVADGEWATLPAALLRESAEYKQAVAGGATDAQALKKLAADKPLMAKLRQDKLRLEAGFLAMDPNTGEVKAWVGSRDFERNQFDHVAQAERQPGSTFKPIVYGAALEAGIGPERSYLDGPVEVRLDARTVWRPTDMHGFSGQMMTLRDGLVYSKNTITAQVSQEVGVPRIVGLAQAMGVDQSKLDPVPSIALGTSPVTLMEMVQAYCTIADQGTRHKPVFIRRIVSGDGESLAEFAAETSRPISQDSAVDLIDMLRGVVNQGTGTMIKSRYNITADVAGKTGTTQNNTDAWFILMHPQLVAGAWVGFDDQRLTIRSTYWGQGGHSAILLVGDFFRDALKGRYIAASEKFPAPRRPVTVTAGLPPGGDDETSYGQIEDVVPGYPPPTQTTQTTQAATGTAGGPAIFITSSTPDASGAALPRGAGQSAVVIGDAPGVAAMRRSAGPPKSAAELDHALGDVLPGSRTSTSGTSAAAPASMAPPPPSTMGQAPPPAPAPPTPQHEDDSDAPAAPP